jgi:hypothetical protein
VHCSIGLLVTVMQAAESALRQAGLHRSASDFEMLLRTFLAVQQRQGRIEGAAALRPAPSAPESIPTRTPRPAAPRRIPGLARKLR